jgi:hypothetical protein
LLDASEVQNDLKSDARWQLIERILSTGPFQKSGRLRELLPHLTERTLHGYGQELTEQNIGIAVFGKPAHYSPTEDSSVRVHARQLRLKLHEYFDGEGRNEDMIVEIPKGSYSPVFHSVVRAPVEVPPTPVITSVADKPEPNRSHVILPWTITAILAFSCLFLGIRLERAPTTPSAPPWPLSAVFDGMNHTQIVIADANYGMLRIISQQEGSLDAYLRPNLQQSLTPPDLSEREARIMSYIANSNLTSYADVKVATTIASMIPDDRKLVSVLSARDLRMRDLDDNGNYVFVGSPGSNPWVSLYESKLNFRESEGVVGKSMKYFVNENPKPGEQKTYQGLEFTGSGGKDYATISLLPISDGRGSVLILQGLQQEGTEAASLFLTNDTLRSELKKALGVQGNPSKPVSFEVLISTRTVDGAPNAMSIEATRNIQ